MFNFCLLFVHFVSFALPLRKSGPVGNRTRISSVQVKYPTIELQAHCYEPFSLVLNFVLTEESLKSFNDYQDKIIFICVMTFYVNHFFQLNLCDYIIPKIFWKSSVIILPNVNDMQDDVYFRI